MNAEDESRHPVRRSIMGGRRRMSRILRVAIPRQNEMLRNVKREVAMEYPVPGTDRDPVHPHCLTLEHEVRHDLRLGIAFVTLFAGPVAAAVYHIVKAVQVHGV